MSAEGIAKLIAERLLARESERDLLSSEQRVVPFHETVPLMCTLEDHRKKDIEVLQQISQSSVQEIYEAFNMLGPEHTFNFALALAGSEELLSRNNYLKACVLFAHQGDADFDPKMAEAIVVHKGHDSYLDEMVTHLYPVASKVYNSRFFPSLKKIFPEFDRVRRAGYSLDKKNVHVQMIESYEDAMIQRLGIEHSDPSFIIPDRGDSFALSSHHSPRVWEAVKDPEKLFFLLDYVFEAWDALEEESLADQDSAVFQKRKAYLATILDFSMSAMPHNACSRLFFHQDKRALTASENLAGSASHYREKGQGALADQILGYVDRLRAYEPKDLMFSQPYEAGRALYKPLERESLENILGYRVISAPKSKLPAVAGHKTLVITALLSELGL